MKTTYIIDLIEIDECPADWRNVLLWKESGTHLCGHCKSIYHVDDHRVTYIGNTRHIPLTKCVSPVPPSDFVQE